MCVGPPASTMNLPWQTETGPHTPLNHCQTLWPERLLHSSLLSGSPLKRKTATEREGGSAEMKRTHQRSSPAEDTYILQRKGFFQCQHLIFKLSCAANAWSFKFLKGGQEGGGCMFLGRPVWRLIVSIFAHFRSCCGFADLGDYWLKLNSCTFLYVMITPVLSLKDTRSSKDAYWFKKNY